jgi:uncharacterized membrane protein
MTTLAAGILRLLELLGTSLWLGGIGTLSFLVAPTLFAKLPTRAQAGELFGQILTRFYVMEWALGAALIALAMLRFKLYEAPLTTTVLRILIVALMIVASLTAQFYIRPQLATLRGKIRNFETTPEDHPLRVQFGKLHQQSVMIMMFNFLGGLLVLLVLLWKA